MNEKFLVDSEGDRGLQAQSHLSWPCLTFQIYESVGISLFEVPPVRYLVVFIFGVGTSERPNRNDTSFFSVCMNGTETDQG